MSSGKVKWFSTQKGFGFIEPDSGGADVFVHISDVQKSGLSGLSEDARVTFEVGEEKGRKKAVNLKLAA